MSFRSATRTPTTLTAPEQRKLLKLTGERRGAEREHMLYSLALGTALRAHELVGLNVGDVIHASEARTQVHLTIFKGMDAKSRRPKAAAAPRRPPRQVVFLPRAVRRKLVYYLKWKKKAGENVRPDAPLFCASQAGFGAARGDRLSRRSIRFHFLRWQERCGFETLHGFHILRHTALSNLYRATKDLLVVKAQARHANVSSTEIYTHVDDDVRRAVEGLEC